MSIELMSKSYAVPILVVVNLLNNRGDGTDAAMTFRNVPSINNGT